MESPRLEPPICSAGEVSAGDKARKENLLLRYYPYAGNMNSEA